MVAKECCLIFHLAAISVETVRAITDYSTHAECHVRLITCTATIKVHVQFEFFSGKIVSMWNHFSEFIPMVPL